ncbi:AhpC/TSA family protein [filamentous cyanobacterium LEGE 11480]|uniref:AhpC/TSA family protein n=1 Tax=Romeriopsis navalis LEGE 11480 TaxID=2777977 RepID=A0A928VP49_9CYAN|nr:peroxiredoxin-like family protein [Romeriopsis navalis]MBE9031182.1 AhpC/TSA family protein [Romeriopsis navalis LEGE 11480]
MNPYEILSQTQRQRVSDGEMTAILEGVDPTQKHLILIWPQLGDFDSLEYAWWLKREADKLRQNQISIRAIGIGDRAAGQQFCEYSGFPAEHLWVDPTAILHRELNLYSGLSLKVPGFNPGQNAWLNLLLMCAGIGSPGTLAEVFRGYKGDRTAPQLIADDETIQATPLPGMQGEFFKYAGGKGFQRPFELATLRLKNMSESLSQWQTYVPDPAYITQRGATFLFDEQRELIYEHRDRGILGFAQNMSQPLTFLDQIEMTTKTTA